MKPPKPKYVVVILDGMDLAHGFASSVDAPAYQKNDIGHGWPQWYASATDPRGPLLTLDDAKERVEHYVEYQRLTRFEALIINLETGNAEARADSGPKFKLNWK